ncbi:MAG: beta-aspartyl-peptidase [Eubacterium sp.]|nr:beta-aspartyl-peptidase [Eubacterium sp.]
MKLIKNADVYEPEHLGKRDILIAGGKIQKIAESIELPEDLDAEVIDAGGLAVTPGFIDCHVHVLGGGGEGGFAFRTPEGTLSGFTRYGITTVVGCLGTDGIAREMTSLVAKTKALRAQGMSAYCYTGSYRVPPTTLTGDIAKDIMMVEEIIGTGEIAISDHRSSQPTYEEFLRVAADTRLGGILSGKAGIINIHLGDSPRCMES